MSGYLLAVLPNGTLPSVRVMCITTQWSSEEGEERRNVSRGAKQAGDIMLVRLPAPNIWSSAEREREEESDKQKRQASW